MRRAQKLGVTKPTDWDLPWLGTLERNEGVLQNALGRLADVERRLIDRLFWFGPSSSDLARLGPAAWPGLPPFTAAKPERNHDIALLMLLHAAVADSQFVDRERWLSAIAAWQKAVSDGDYWMSLLDQDQRGGFEPMANVEDITALRCRAMHLGLSVMAEAAKADVAKGGQTVVSRVLAIIQSAPLDDELRFTFENEIIGPLEEEIARVSGEIRSECRNKIVREDAAAAANKEPCAAATQRLDTEILPRLARLEAIAGKDTVFAQRARGDVAHAFDEIATHWTWADNLVKSEELLNRAKALALGTPAEGRIKEEAKKVTNQARRQRDKVKPVTRTPSLYTVKGIGTKLYSLGISYPHIPELHYATLYFVVLFIPLIPLRRYLVTPGPGKSWYFHYTIRFGVVQWVHLAVVLLFNPLFPLIAPILLLFGGLR